MSSRPLPFDAIAEARRQWESHGWPAPNAMAAVTSIMRAQQIILARVDAALRPHDLTFARYEALVLLYFSRQGALPLGKMGDRLMLHPTSVTNIADRLEQQGLIKRVRHPTDRRTTLAEITPEGREVVEEATRVAAGEAALGIGGLSDRELDRLTKLLRKVRVDAGDFPEE
ncbi:MAG TPA: MarR family transcriptional regulator [Acidimicrobiales bacterium]